MKKRIALLLAPVLVTCLLAGCSGRKPEETRPEETPGRQTLAEDTITIMVPPITGDYTDLLEKWIAGFTAEHPNLHVEVIATFWDEHSSKLTALARDNRAPDIAQVSAGAMGAYVEMGAAVNIADYLDAGTLADYDRNALDCMTLDNTLCGLPLYLTVQALGGNRAMLEQAGVDVDKVQNEGWSYEAFLAALEKGTGDGTFGFVFANAGAAAADFLEVFGVSAGLTGSFTSGQKYAYTSENMKDLLLAVETMVASGYMPDYPVEPGQRLAMLMTGEAMLTGKAMPLFESNVNRNNAGIADGSAAEGSMEVEYVFLPVPTMEGVSESCYGTVEGMIVLRNENAAPEHLKNVCLFLNYICSGPRVAEINNELLLTCVCLSGRDAQAAAGGFQAPDNAAATARSVRLAAAPAVGVTAEQASNAGAVMNGTIVPGFQALLAGETTAEALYGEICTAAFALFGREGCETGRVG